MEAVLGGVNYSGGESGVRGKQGCVGGSRGKEAVCHLINGFGRNWGPVTHVASDLPKIDPKILANKKEKKKEKKGTGNWKKK